MIRKQVIYYINYKELSYAYLKYTHAYIYREDFKCIIYIAYLHIISFLQSIKMSDGYCGDEKEAEDGQTTIKCARGCSPKLGELVAADTNGAKV